MNSRIINGIVIALLVVCIAIVTPMASAAGEPTVQVSEYKVNPSIMMPDTLGTITIVLKNTATSAQQKENSGVLASEFQTSITECLGRRFQCWRAGRGQALRQFWGFGGWCRRSDYQHVEREQYRRQT